MAALCLLLQLTVLIHVQSCMPLPWPRRVVQHIPRGTSQQAMYLVSRLATGASVIISVRLRRVVEFAHLPTISPRTSTPYYMVLELGIEGTSGYAAAMYKGPFTHRMTTTDGDVVRHSRIELMHFSWCVHNFYTAIRYHPMLCTIVRQYNGRCRLVCEWAPRTEQTSCNNGLKRRFHIRVALRSLARTCSHSLVPGNGALELRYCK